MNKTITVAIIGILVMGSSKSVLASASTTGKCKCEATRFADCVKFGQGDNVEDQVAIAVAAAKAQADAAAAQAEAAAAKAQADAAAAQATIVQGVTQGVAPNTSAQVAAAQAAAAAAKAQADAAAAQATAGAVNEQNPGNIITNPVVGAIMIQRVINPVNGDIIETSFDAKTETTTTNMICERKDSPDTLTVTRPLGTDTTIVGDGDIFNCNVGYYGNNIAPVNIPANYKSSAKLELKNASVMTGEINNNNMIQYVSMTIDRSSKWIVEGTSYLTVLINEDTTLSNIVDNGNTIYYDSLDKENAWLGAKTYTLSGGGKLQPMN